MACLDAQMWKFLGATITGINSNLGWGSKGTSFDISLVEDLCNGDNFDPPIIGSPVCVNIGGDEDTPGVAGQWGYGGFLDNWEFKSSVSAGHTFDVKITDPTDLLSGYQCILNNYDGGTFGVPNLGNVFGYLENYLGGPCLDFLSGDSSGVNYTPAFGWGGSHKNAGGIPSTLVLLALDAILNGLGGTFGDFPYYRDHVYYVDLSRLKTLPVYNYNYRIAGENMSVLDIIDRMCKDSGFDYYLGLDCEKGSTVTVYPIPINYFAGYGGANIMDVSGADIDAGDIAKALGEGLEYSNKQIGLTHRKETLNSFTVGDNFQGVHQVSAVATCSPVDATIWPYWGDDWTGTPILGFGCNDAHCFIADSREWNVLGLGAFYPLCVAEMRAAMIGQDEWKSWMLIHKPEFMKWLDPDFAFDEFLEILLGIRKPKPRAAKDPGKARGNANKRLNNVEKREKNVTQLFNAIKGIAEEFYGKKFMVVIPFVCKYLEDETGELKTNWEKTDSGWSEIGVIGLTNPSIGLLIFKDEQGKIGCFVRYDNAEQLDLTGLQKGDFYFESGYVWIKANVQKLVQTGGKFWAVIDLKSRIMMSRQENDEDGNDFFLKLIEDAVAAGGFDRAAADKLIDKAKPKKDVDGKVSYMQNGPRSVLPSAAAIPLKSAKVSYGPWYGGYLGGKTEYNRDPTFAPWNFGAVSQMQLAGTIHTIHKVTHQEVSEKGSLTTPGYPVAFLADRAGIITGKGNFGPIITDIQVKYDTSGITTTYSFKTHVAKWGQLSKNIIEGMQRRGQAMHKQNHQLLQRLLEPPPPNSAIYRMRIHALDVLKLDAPDKDKNASTHDMFMTSTDIYDKETYADADWTGDNETAGYTNVVTGKWENDFCWLDCVNEDAEWIKTAGVEPMGIFRPFSTESSGTMSYFKDLEENDSYGHSDHTEAVEFNEDSGVADVNKFYPRAPEPPVNEEYNMPITVKTLNPFKGHGGDEIYGFEHMNDSDSMKHDIDYVVRGETFPVDATLGGVDLTDTHYRAISLRGPMIITGWGFDIDGKPVPAAPEDDGKQPSKFLDDWLHKPYEWKTGPLDVRWDDDRGLWVAPPSFKLVNAKACECVGPTNTETGWFELTGDDADDKKLDKDGDQVGGEDDNCNCEVDDKKQVVAVNKTGKVVLPDAKVLLYFDTRWHKYHIITAPDPIVIATMDKLMLPEFEDDDYATATISKGIHDLGTFSDDCAKIVRVTNTLKQPICEGNKAFIYLTTCESSASDGGGDDYDFKGEVLQAEFEPLTVVTSVDCYEASDTGEPTLEICDRRIYLQTAWTIEDCGDDDPKKRFDTKGWRPEVDDDDKKNQEPIDTDFCPSDWNNKTV